MVSTPARTQPLQTKGPAALILVLTPATAPLAFTLAKALLAFTVAFTLVLTPTKATLAFTLAKARKPHRRAVSAELQLTTSAMAHWGFPKGLARLLLLLMMMLMKLVLHLVVLMLLLPIHTACQLSATAAVTQQHMASKHTGQSRHKSRAVGTKCCRGAAFGTAGSFPCIKSSHAQNRSRGNPRRSAWKIVPSRRVSHTKQPLVRMDGVSVGCRFQ